MSGPYLRALTGHGEKVSLGLKHPGCGRSPLRIQLLTLLQQSTLKTPEPGKPEEPVSPPPIEA